jgi:AAA family ATP:ADP antiporter
VSAAAAAASSNGAAVHPNPLAAAAAALASTAASARAQVARLDGLWGRFLPMSAMFFLMSFINTVVDSLKDSLVVTAVGGGTQVLPYLSVYAVLPSSLAFLLLYSWGTQHFSRERLFNAIVAAFLVALAAFGAAYPHHEALHLAAWADGLAGALPPGLAGAVGMVRNWLFTGFYCLAELWGDVVLSLLFWGLANETTSIEDAPLLYPLFGIGANVAQTAAGRGLRVFSDAAAGRLSVAAQLQFAVGTCLCLGAVILALHTYISRTFPLNPKGSTEGRRAAAAAATAAAAAAAVGAGAGAAAGGHAHVAADSFAGAVRGLNYCDLRDAPSQLRRLDDIAAAAGGGNGNGAAAAPPLPPPLPPPAAPEKRRRAPMGLKAAFAFLAASPQIRCLAVMALAQGVATRLLQVSWMHYLHQLHSTPAAYAAVLGDTAMWTGIATAALMCLSPVLFDRLGWRGVAATTPTIMLWGGIPFFIGCLAYNGMATAAVPSAPATLALLVAAGAGMQIFSRASKFSLFKPAEEMVYIGLDDESRTKGKAAIDVVAAQSGKSASSLLQQALLIATSGTVASILPVLAVFYSVMLTRWTAAVKELAEHYDPARVHRLSIMGSVDEEDEAGAGGADAAGGAAALVPDAAAA